ncbi:signal peptidase I [Microbacterium sp. BWT-B31]|uniref:signal peptidase I n=1 Tax=Microbacterium sp. BWT-B31 TaxID=3232072 RepID=UPI00352810A9
MPVIRRLQDTLCIAVAVVGAASIVVIAVFLVLGLQPALVVSGSMEPALPVGAIVVTREVPASQLHVGDIIQVPRTSDASVVTHRIHSIERSGTGYAVVLKGDANELADVEPYVIESARLYRTHIPLVGYAVAWVKEYPLVCGLLLVGVLVLCFWGRGHRVSVRTPDGETNHGLTRREADEMVAAFQAEQDGAVAPQHGSADAPGGSPGDLVRP